MRAVVDVSAQFGGMDAQTAMMPCFLALKSASKNFELSDFPVGDLTFILRVDGEIRGYDLNGLGPIDISTKKGYISIDLGIPLTARAEAGTFIASAIEMAAEHLSMSENSIIQGLDLNGLEADLRLYAKRFLNYLFESQS